MLPNATSAMSQAHALTLTGLETESVAEAANLDTHIDDVARYLAERDLTEVVLCGHSYGGMVICGVVDVCPDRLAGLVYIDAYVPNSGDSCWSLTSEKFRTMFVSGSRRTGLLVDPPPGLDPRAVAHPLASLMQGLRITGREDGELRHCYIYLSQWSDSPFTIVYERLRTDPSWQTVTLPTAHNILRQAPRLLVDTILQETEAW